MQAGKGVIVAMLLGAAPLSAQGTPAVGAMAPDFALAGATVDGVLPQPVKLSDLRGRTVVLAFYPKARTSGCTVQMKAYRDQYATIFAGGKDVTLLAISADADTTLAAWAKEESFPFTFLSDVGGAVGKTYGVFNEKYNLDSRVLFVVGPDGRITYVASPFREVDPTSYTALGAEVQKAVAGKS